MRIKMREFAQVKTRSFQRLELKYKKVQQEQEDISSSKYAKIR